MFPALNGGALKVQAPACAGEEHMEGNHGGLPLPRPDCVGQAPVPALFVPSSAREGGELLF